MAAAAVVRDRPSGAGRRCCRQPARQPAQSSKLRDDDLRAIQERRTLPVRFTQWLQLTIQRRIIGRVLESQRRPKPPLFFKLFGIFPALRRVPAWLTGIGIRPEHVRTAEAASL